MEPITSSQTFEQDPNMLIEEQEDGSALIEMPEEETVETNHFDNLAETLDTFKLNTLATDLLELVEKDKESRKKRDEQYQEGLKRTGLGDDAPGGAMFDGASRIVHPVLAEGCVDFAARAIKELVPANGPVKAKIIGKADRDVLDRAKRKTDYLNWLLTKKMRSYRDEKEILLTQLPLGGSQYEKYYPDPVSGNYVMEFVPVDKVLLPFSAVSFYSSPRVTQMLDLTRAEFESRIKSGFYKDIENVLEATEETPEETAAEQANDKIEGRSESSYNEDGLRRVYEISCNVAVEGEEVAPYIVHIDEPSSRVVAVYRNWAEDDENQERLDWWVEDKFIPWRGAYGVGLPHLIGGLAGALTGALRALLDSAHINNSPGAVKLKGGRASGQNLTIEQTQVVELDAPPGTSDIRQVIMPLPFNPPSPVLFQLLDWITGQAKGVVATSEEKIADAGNNMPVGTTLALIEQGSHVFSSIHARLHESQRRSLEIICRLVRDYPNEEDLRRFELTVEDFQDDDDVEPVSDPRIFSEAQRFAQLQEQMKLMQAFPDLNWDREEMARRALILLRCDSADGVLKAKPPEVTADPVTENFMAATGGAALKASPEQDHVAHIKAHLEFILDPLYGSGPAIPGQHLTLILANIQEHMMQIYLGAAKTAAAIGAMASGQTSESVIADGASFAMKQLQQAMPEFQQMLAQAAQVVQGKMPQPPVDPAVEKTFEAAMAEIQRKTQEGQATLQLATQKMQAEYQLKTQELQASVQSEQQKQAMDMRLAEMGNVIKLQTAAIQEEGNRAAEELRAQIALMKNEQDNEQKQMTELLKNYQDNVTQLQLALQQVNEKVEGSAPDFTPQVEQLNQMLATVEKQKGQDALTTVTQGLQAVIETMNRPKMIIEDAQGRPVGIQ